MSAATTPTDIGAAIRSARTTAGLTQAELARRAGVGRQWLSAVELGHERAEIGKITAVLAALGCTIAIRDTPIPKAEARTWLTAADVARGIREDIASGDTGFALRTLARGLSEFRCLDPDDTHLFLAEPPSTGDPRWNTLIAAAISRACRLRGIKAPEWTQVPPLRSWWFPVFDPILAARAIQRTPPDLAVKGIWLEASALEVV